MWFGYSYTYQFTGGVHNDLHLYNFNPLFSNLSSASKRYYSTGSSLLQGLGPDGATPLSDYLSQMMTGLLLSDGTLVKKYAGGGTYF